MLVVAGVLALGVVGRVGAEPVAGRRYLLHVSGMT